MNSPSFPPLKTETVNELAKERNREAAERTLTTWIQNSLTLIGLGIALDRIQTVLSRLFPELSLDFSQQLTYQLGLILIALAIILLLIAMKQYQLHLQAIEREDYLFLSSQPLTKLTTVSVIGFGVIAALIMIIKYL